METKNITINIFDEVGGNSAISVDDGDRIFQRIDSALSSNIAVTLNFQSINIIITAFLNACIGQLYSKYSSEQLQQNLSLKNVSKENTQIFKKVIQRAKEYFSNPDDIDNSVNEVLGDD